MLDRFFISSEESALSYQVIARKWRPQSFQEMVGQTHISTTLQNALKNDRIHHALLFTGPRGTGKTSSARILAKAIRCPNAVDFVPCNTCPSCLEITNGSSVDVIEIDGASNNGVDAIRELRDTVSYMPASGSVKVYIIDEVHMLSTSAFNALLKTLEEPPSHVIFIMATTEVQKIPQTILSRCQRFDFRRISTKTISQYLKKICEAENVKATEEALWPIARQGDGSMRDSLSLLDQVITFANGELTADKVSEILGLTDRNLVLETLNAVLNKKPESVLQVLEKLNQSSITPNLFIQDVLESMRHLILVKVSGSEVTHLIELPDSELTHFVQLANLLSEPDLHMLFDMTLKGTQDVLKSANPQMVLEVVLLRLASAPGVIDIKKLASHLSAGGGIANLPKPLEERNAPLVIKKSPAQASRKINKMDFVSHKNVSDTEKWLLFIDLVRYEDALFAAKIENLIFVETRDKTLLLGVPPKLVYLKEQMKEPQIRQKVQGFIDSFWGEGYSFEVSLNAKENAGETAVQIMAQKKADEEELFRKHLEQDPRMQLAKKLFKSKIVEIKNLNKKV